MAVAVIAVAVIAVAVMLMPVLVFVLVLLVVFVLALLVLMFVGAKGTAENVRNSHFVLPSFFTWELFPAAARQASLTSIRRQPGNFLP